VVGERELDAATQLLRRHALAQAKDERAVSREAEPAGKGAAEAGGG
jgi:hypothetical protein